MERGEGQRKPGSFYCVSAPLLALVLALALALILALLLVLMLVPVLVHGIPVNISLASSSSVPTRPDGQAQSWMCSSFSSRLHTTAYYRAGVGESGHADE